MLDLPGWLTFLFIFTTLFAYVLFLFALMNGNERVKRRMHVVALLLLAWIIFQSTLSLNGWYMDREAKPPHLFFPVSVALVITGLLFLTPRGRRFTSGLSAETLTWLHVVRIPVEISLYWLAVYRQVPWSMTFYGHNFDIVFGITAPVVAYLAYRKKILPPKMLKIWNVLGLISLLVIVVTAAGAAPGSAQLWSFDQPDFAIIHFPFSWLPAFIAPVVLYAHLAVLLRKENSSIPDRVIGREND